MITLTFIQYNTWLLAAKPSVQVYNVTLRVTFVLAQHLNDINTYILHCHFKVQGVAWRTSTLTRTLHISSDQSYMVFIQYHTWLFAAKTSNVGSANAPLLPNPTIALFRPLGVFGGCVCHCDQVQLCEGEWHIGKTQNVADQTNDVTQRPFCPCGSPTSFSS